jgi:D-beta-D-heptose 7-phosphate kinase/D-beta-D-heptose 1-phosphate adenosyltransferase
MQLIDKFKGLQILVAGDLMLDRYWWGTVSRISPEAPVPVVRIVERSEVPGGAANVARNVIGLGASPILLGAIGDDDDGRVLRESLIHEGIDTSNVVSVDGWQTIVKTRIVAHGQHVVRVDQESVTSLPASDEQVLLGRIESLVIASDAVLISDYAKGFLSNATLRTLIDTARKLGKPVIVDPKGLDFAKYKRATVITPNKREAADACGLDPAALNSVELAGEQIIRNTSIPNVLITRSEEGMSLFTEGGNQEIFPAETVETFDVTGAGDTVLACLGVGIAAGLSVAEAARLANTAAGIVIGQVGTSAISSAELADRIETKRNAAG